MLDAFVQDLALTGSGPGPSGLDFFSTVEPPTGEVRVAEGLAFPKTELLDSPVILLDEILDFEQPSETASLNLILASFEVVPSDETLDLLDPEHDTAYVWGEKLVGDDTPRSGGGGRYVPRTAGDGGETSDPPPPPFTWTDPLQPTENACANESIKITVDGNNVTITATISFVGAGADAATNAQLVNAVSSKWTGNFGPYSVTTNITMGSGGSTANVSDSPFGQPYIDRLGGTNIQTFTLQGVEFSHFTLDSFAHEFGHALGLMDFYDTRGNKGRHPDYDNNIMGNSAAPPNWQNIRDLIAKRAKGCP